MENQKKISDTLKGKKQKNGKRKTKEHGHASIGRKTEKLKTQKSSRESSSPRLFFTLCILCPRLFFTLCILGFSLLLTLCQTQTLF